MGASVGEVRRKPLVVVEKRQLDWLMRSFEPVNLAEAILHLRRQEDLTLFLSEVVRRDLEGWLADGNWREFHFPPGAIVNGKCPERPVEFTIWAIERASDDGVNSGFDVFSVDWKMSPFQWRLFYTFFHRG